MSKKILVHLPAIAKCVGGGVATQAEMTVQALEQRGVPVVRYNPWKEYDWSEFGVVHIFRGDYETDNFAKLIKSKEIPLLVSPVFFSSHSVSKIKLSRIFTALGRKVFSGVRSDLDYVADVAQSATKLLPNTEEESRLIQEAFGISDSQCEVVHNGVSDRFGQAQADLFFETYGEKDIVLSVANLGYRRKNMLQAIKAMAQTELSYYIIGPSYDNEYGRQCVQAIEQASNIHYLGAMDNDSPLLASAYAAAKTFLLPSLFETPGIASMEAALAGAEVVTTPYGGVKEYFGKSAYYVDPHSVNSIKEAVLSCTETSPLNPGKVIAENYLWEHIAEKMERIYKEYL